MNKDCKAIHETFLKDIMDLWDGFKSMKDEIKDKKFSDKSNSPLGKMNSTSIAKANSNLVMVFPVICSRGISIETASMISKAVEKNAVSMLQRLFAAWQITDAENVHDYIGLFHKNISSKVASLDDVFDVATRIDARNESALSAGQIYAYESAVKNDLRNNLNRYLPTSVNESSLNEYIIYEDGSADKASGKANVDGGTEADKVGGSEIKKASGLADIAKSQNDVFKNQVLDSDYKKANELMPTSLVVNFKAYKDTDDEGNKLSAPIVHDYTNAIVGVKAKLYPVGSDDIVTHIADKAQSKNWLTNFFRATTRETSFMKDFVLAIDKAKIDAMSLSTRKSTSDKMWKVLERRATVSRLKRAMRDNNSSAAITTLVVSQEEVEYLRKNNLADLERVSTVLGLFDSLNLMCICIVDESLEVAKFIYDEEDPTWETISFTHLERESSDNTYKRVVNLMTKVAR